MGLLELLKLPEVKSIEDLDDPASTALHRRIIQRKGFLKKLYIDFYRQFKCEMSRCEGKVLVELGSGGGFIKDVIPNVITSDVLELDSVDRVFSATDMPFDNASVDAFFMIDVLHHLPRPRLFFSEALRCLKPGGGIIMIEPANTVWSRFIYRNFHHEPFEPEAEWELDEGGPLSGANGAIPWIIFGRDRHLFEREFPDLKIISVRRHTPIRYLLSGGFTLRQLVPGWSYGLVKGFEYIVSPLNGITGMFQTIVLRKGG